MFKSKPTIVVPVFDREDCFSRLLAKLEKSHYYSDDINLVISIDKSWNKNITNIADEFDWEHGNKEIIRHNSHLGLKEHILYCGDLTDKYDSIIIIEDDVILSKEYYSFALSALKKFKRDKNIFSISFTGLPFDELAFRQFYPVDDGYDNYFTNTAATWAFTLTKRSWKTFRKWYEKKINTDMDFSGLPDSVKNWSDNSFKKYLNLYLLENEKYFVIPRKHLAVNSGDVGTHYDKENLNFAAPILIGNGEFRYQSFDTSLAKYDAFLEIDSKNLKDLVPELRDYDFTVDLKGIKPKKTINTDLILTSRTCTNSIKSYGLKLVPFEINIIERIKGDHFNLCRIEDCNFSDKSEEKRSRELSAIHKLYALNATDEEIIAARNLKFD